MKIWIFLLCLLLSPIVHAENVPAFYGSQQQVKINHATIAYYRFGQGDPLVLITGHGDNMLMWHPVFLHRLSQQHEIIIFDYPGIGASTMQGAYPNTMAQLADLVHAFIKSQQLKNPNLLGFSMGGSLVLYMTTRYGKEYNHIIAVGAKAGGKKTVVPQKKYFAMLSDPSIPPAVAIKTLLFPADASKQADAYLAVLKQMPQEKMTSAALKAQAQAVDAENQGPGIWDQLSQIKNHVLLMNGTDDVLTPVQNAVLITAAIPGAWLMQMAGAGHGVLFQEPVFTSRLINLFLES